jgi:hypothetical protein
MMTAATFVLSTGRCGTQWLTQALAVAAGAAARVEHEPLHNGYCPREMFGARTPERLPGAARDVVLGHVATIERELETRDYIETGHPCWSSVPWLCERLAGRVRVIHLVRHPVPTACSWLSHGAFVPPWLPHLRVKELLSPMDAGVAFPEYRERWPALTPFEKCLYYWGEVNALGLRLERAGRVPWLRVRYEDLFGEAGAGELASVLRFLRMPEAPVARMDRGERVDRHHFALGGLPDFTALDSHPRLAAVAAELGYDWQAFSVEELGRRFGGAQT